MLVKPTTAYLVQYSPLGCFAECLFCPQSTKSNSRKEYVSRIPWPAVELSLIIQKLLEREEEFERVCVQSILKSNFQKEMLEIVKTIRKSGIDLPISVASTPISSEVLKALKKEGVDKFGVGLDVASEELFNRFKKPFKWQNFWNFLRKAVSVFGKGNVHAHLIFGLGESELEFYRTMQRLYDLGVRVALFAFTPVSGTPLENLPKPQIERYRKAQIVRYLIEEGFRIEEILTESEGTITLSKKFEVEEIQDAFLTSGCPGCNRPFYNESPSEIYNYPSREILLREIDKIREQLAVVFR